MRYAIFCTFPAVRVIQVSGLALFSDAYVGRRPRVCVTSAGYASCFDGSCYSTSKMCNGVEDCADGADEFSCECIVVPKALL